ncbi:lysozyme inhibitor LprI family protein [Paraburkholderia sp. 40]|uniref:lysozyme inhibitor LprI family protein n=1 Tax=unclassified Paraburkholderia TaxID=2615204 RepID=UPI003D201BAE
MIHRTSLILALTIAPIIAPAKTVYSGKFDYHYFKSPDQYFSGHSAADVAHMCDTGEHASNDDLAQCSHRKFDHAARALDKILRSAKSKIGGNDSSLKAEGEPLALPYFLKSQDAWAQYRDNECYTETYMMGEAAERYIFFWECMANITRDRVKELQEVLRD